MGMLVDGTWFDDDPPPDRTGRVRAAGFDAFATG